MSQEIIIRSENDAFALIKKLQSNEVDADAIDLKFDGWPLLELHIEGPKYHNSITPSMMKGFIELQRGVHRAFAYAKYGTYNVNKLTDEEKQKLELSIEVSDGSSIFGVDLEEILESFGLRDAVSNMSGKEIIFLVLVLGTIYAGSTSYKAYLDDRRETRVLEVTSEEKIKHLETLSFMSTQETERMKIISDLATKYSSIENAQRHAYDSKTEIFKRAGTAKNIEFDNVSISGEDAQFLTRNAKRKSEDIRMDGSYRLLEVNSSLASDFKVKVRNIDTGSIFWSHVQESSLTTPIRKALIEAEWGKFPVKLKINAKDLAGTISKAMIIGVTALTEKEVEEYKKVRSDLASMTN